MHQDLEKMLQGARNCLEGQALFFLLEHFIVAIFIVINIF